MHKKFTSEAVSFLKELLNTILSEQLKLKTATDFSQHFPCIKIKDSESFHYPAIIIMNTPDMETSVKRMG